MKTTENENTFDTVKVFREIKEKVSQELVGKNFEQVKAYLRANSLQLQQNNSNTDIPQKRSAVPLRTTRRKKELA